MAKPHKIRCTSEFDHTCDWLPKLDSFKSAGCRCSLYDSKCYYFVHPRSRFDSLVSLQLPQHHSLESLRDRFLRQLHHLSQNVNHPGHHLFPHVPDEYSMDQKQRGTNSHDPRYNQSVSFSKPGWWRSCCLRMHSYAIKC